MDFWSSKRFEGSCLRETTRSRSLEVGEVEEAAGEADCERVGNGKRKAKNKMVGIATAQKAEREKRMDLVYRKTCDGHYFDLTAEDCLRHQQILLLYGACALIETGNETGRITAARKPSIRHPRLIVFHLPGSS